MPNHILYLSSSILSDPLFPRSSFFLTHSLMARAMTRTAPHSTTPALSKASSFPPLSAAATHFGDIHLWKNFSVFGLRATVGLRGLNGEEGRVLGGSRTRVTCVGSGGGEKGYMKGREKALTRSGRKELELSVEVLIEEGLTHDDPQLLVHGLLHLLGFDHETSEEAEAEMEKVEELLLKNLGWKEKGLIKSAYDAKKNGCLHIENPDDRKREGSLESRPKFKYIFCDMDGTLRNSKSQVSSANANALRKAMSRGIQVVIATGKTVDLFGRDGVLSESSPGVFIQGLLVYGRYGQEIFRRNLDPDFCREVFLYSLQHQIPLVAFCGDRCLTLFDHPLVEALHSVYHEPKAEIMPTVERLLAAADIQKLLFLDGAAESISDTLRPYWSKAAGECANVVQAIPGMLELVPRGNSKGNGVKLLLDHLGGSPKEIMAIGDGENDIEMLELAGLGVALSNGSEKAKAVAGVIGVSNDEDGVADAIYRFAF